MAYYRYLMITHMVHPTREHNTAMKDWGTLGKKQIQEYTEFSQKIKDKQFVEATYIYDIREKKMAKNRYRNSIKEEQVVTDENVIDYIMKEYKSEIIKMGWPEEHFMEENK